MFKLFSIKTFLEFKLLMLLYTGIQEFDIDINI